jgi:hypothetical protein
MLQSAPWQLMAFAAAALLLGALPFAWWIRHLVRAARRQPRPNVSLMRHAYTLAASAALIGAGLGALGLAAALQTWHAFTNKVHAAEVQCIELSPQKLRVYLVPIAADGKRGEQETYEVDGDEWTVGGDVLRFRPELTVLGLETVYSVTRVEGRWLKAADANAHPGTAHDRQGGTSWGWLMLYKDGARGPLGWLVAGAHGQAVSQLPDRRAVYDLYVTPNGFVLDKRSL